MQVSRITDLHGVIFNISKALKPERYIMLPLNIGILKGKRNGRYFINFTEESLNSLVEAFHELDIIEVVITGDVRDGRENEKWLNIIIKKIIS